jgi:hypothetical protein
MDRGAERQPEIAAARVVRGQQLDRGCKLQGRAHGALRRVFVRLWIAEVERQAVAHGIADRAAEALRGPGRGRPYLGQDFVDDLQVERRGDGEPVDLSDAGQLAKCQRDLPPLADGPGAPGRVPERGA